MEPTGIVVEPAKFQTTPFNLIKLAHRFPQSVFVLEESTMAQWFVETLSPHAADVFVSEPKQNKWITSGSKSDALDAYKLAMMYLVGSLRRVYHSLDHGLVEFKRTVQYREMLSRQGTAVQNWIKAKFREYGIVPKGASVYRPGDREEAMKLLPELAQARLRHAYARLDQLEQQEKEAVRQMVEQSRAYPEVSRFTGVPGIGRIGACTFFAVIQTPHRFADKHALWSYSALKVVTKESAGKSIGRPYLTRGGVRSLKTMSRHAFLAALRTAHGDNPISQFYRRRREAGLQEHAARLTTQRKILSILWHLWKTGEEFNPNKV
jgi:transposase